MSSSPYSGLTFGGSIAYAGDPPDPSTAIVAASGPGTPEVAGDGSLQGTATALSIPELSDASDIGPSRTVRSLPAASEPASPINLTIIEKGASVSLVALLPELPGMSRASLRKACAEQLERLGLRLGRLTVNGIQSDNLLDQEGGIDGPRAD